jgi:hypothetical protein
MQPPSRLRGHDLHLLVLAACVAVAVTGGCLATAVLSKFNDAFIYMSIAEHLARGEGYRSSSFMLPELIEPPLYPLLIAAGLLVTRNPFAVTIAIQCGCAALSVVGLVHLHRWLWGDTGWRFTAVVAAFCPALGLAAMLASEPIFCCLLVWSFTLAVAGYHTQKASRVFLSALLAGLSVLARPEGLALTGLIVVMPLFAAGSLARRSANSAIAAGTAAALLVPYVLFVHSHLGYYTVTPKVVFNLTQAHLLEDIEWQPEELGIRSRDARITAALMPDHRELVLTEKFLHPEIDVRSLFPLRPHHPWLSLLRSLRGGLRIFVWVGVKRLGILNPLLVALTVLAAVRGLRATRFNWPMLALIGLIAANLVPSLVRGFIVESRFLAGATLLCAPLVGYGASLLLDLARRRLPSTPGWTNASAVGVGLLLAGVSLPPLVALAHESGSGGDSSAMREEGEACVRLMPQGATIASLNFRCPFLVHGTHFLLPYVQSIGELSSYLDQHAVSYVEVDRDAVAQHVSRVIRDLGTQGGLPGWTPLGDTTGQLLFFHIERNRPSDEPSPRGDPAVEAAHTPAAP